MALIDALTVPLDPTSAATLAENGLEYRRVLADTDAFAPFQQAVNRGFLGEEATEEQVTWSVEAMAARRMLGIYDPASVETSAPVATVDSWVVEMTTEPGRTLPMWGISGVTVSSTHRRRGIATAMLQGELRAAADAGIPIAGLTVSEATIYGRFGFGPAVYTTRWEVETARARWIGPRPEGRLDAVTREVLEQDLASVHERVRLHHPGEVAGYVGLWRRAAGLNSGNTESRKIRGLRFTSPDGAVRGSLAYVLEENENDYTKSTLHIHHLIADGDDAYAALWRFALEHDLVGTVKAYLLSEDEPVRWMIADQRGIKAVTTDHEWLRILDVEAVLGSRSYRVPGSVTIQVSDPLGLAEGTWRLVVDDAGQATVTAASTDEAGDADVTVSVAVLGSLLLGGVSARTLRTAGLVKASAETAQWLDQAFAPTARPRLSLWY